MRLKAFLFLLLAMILLALQSTLVPVIALRGVIPNLMLCFVVSISLLTGSVWGRRIGLFIGFLMDILFLNILGFYSLLFFLLGQTAGLFRNGFESDNLILTVGLTALFDFGYALICYLFTHYFRGHVQFGYYLVHFVLAEVVYTVPFSVPIYLLIRFLNQKLDRLDRHRSHPHEGKMSAVAGSNGGESV